MDHFADGPTDYWSDTYRGCHIALLRHHRRWCVFLERVFQTDTHFETADDAAAWLRRRIDERTLAQA
jgi:hypothetical protein